MKKTIPPTFMRPDTRYRTTPNRMLRTTFSYITTQELLGTKGDNGATGMQAAFMATLMKDSGASDEDRLALGRAMRDLTELAYRNTPYREGGEVYGSEISFRVDYAPNRELAAVVDYALGSDDRRPLGFWPMKTNASTIVGDRDHAPYVSVRAGYGAPTVAYYPLRDGRVFRTDLTGLKVDTLDYLVAQHDARLVDSPPNFDLVNWSWLEYGASLGEPTEWIDAIAEEAEEE